MRYVTYIQFPFSWQIPTWYINVKYVIYKERMEGSNWIITLAFYWFITEDIQKFNRLLFYLLTCNISGQFQTSGISQILHDYLWSKEILTPINGLCYLKSMILFYIGCSLKTNRQWSFPINQWKLNSNYPNTISAYNESKLKWSFSNQSIVIPLKYSPQIQRSLKNNLSCIGELSWQINEALLLKKRVRKRTFRE